MSFIKKIKNLITHILLSNKFYNFFFKPFDTFLYPIVKHQNIVEERNLCKIFLNKIPHIADVINPEWRSSSKELGEHYWCIDKPNFHRKLWEYNQILFSLKKLKYLTPDSVGLSVGAGHEPLLYYLTYKIKKIYGIDLYENTFFGAEDNKDTIESIEKYAPFPYNKNKLELFRMDARVQQFSNNFFDFIFSISSIEHFGTKKNIEKSIKEMYRVLKPGGILVITTELKLNRLGSNIPGTKIFTLKKLRNLFLHNGFKLFQNDIDLRIEEEYLKEIIKLPDEALNRPHIILRFFKTIFTSVNLVFKKDGKDALVGNEIQPNIPEFLYRGDIFIQSEKKFFSPGEDIRIKINLKNRGTLNWFVKGISHRIAMGVKLLNKESYILNQNYTDIPIPSNVFIGETIEFFTIIKSPQKEGYYKLQFDLKRELITWFSERGNKPFTLDIQVQ